MKKEYLGVAFLLLIGLGCSHCSKSRPPSPKPEDPHTVSTFEVHGKEMCGSVPCIQIKGEMKPAAKISMQHAKSAVAISVGVLEK